MPIGVTFIDGVVIRIRIPVRADAGLVGVPPIGGDEAADGGVVVAGMEVEEAGLGIMGLADIALLLLMAGRRGFQPPVAIGEIGRALDRRARIIRDQPHRFEMIAMVEEGLRRRSRAHPLEVGMRVFRPHIRIGLHVVRKLVFRPDIGARADRTARSRIRRLAQALPVRTIDERRKTN